MKADWNMPNMNRATYSITKLSTMPVISDIELQPQAAITISHLRFVLSEITPPKMAKVAKLSVKAGPER